MNTFDLDPKGFLPLIQPLVKRVLEKFGLRAAQSGRANVTCCV